MKYLHSNPKVSLFQSSLLLLASTLIIIIRYPSFILKPRMWGEESLYYETFFSNPNILDGFDALIYPAYYVLISRIVGFLASLVDPENAATVTTICGLIVLSIPLMIIFFGNSKYWSTMYQKVFLSAFLIFSCSTGEIWMNSTNVGFIMPVVTFLILMDENPGGYLKRFLYSLCLFLAILTGPISLLMSPFFLYRFIQRKEPVYLIYCTLFLVFGLLQISYLLVVSSLEVPIGNLSRGIFNPISFTESYIYWISPNIIFPIFGYFLATAFRTFALLSHQNPEQLISLSELLPFNAGAIVELLIYIAPVLIIFISVITFIIYIYFFKRSNIDEKVYMLILFAYLSPLFTVLSLGGHGGYRYSYICSFILLFYLFQRFIFLSSGLERSFIKSAISISLIVGVLEYYPRVISFSPDFRTGEEPEWPNWKNEVITWKNNPSYKVKIWPYLREGTSLWPERVDVWSVDLSNDKYWDDVGNHKYSKELADYLQTSDD